MEIDSSTGLYISGRVIGRTRRKILTKKNEVKYLVCIALAVPGTIAMLEMWSTMPNPPGLPEMGTRFETAVNVQPYIRNGLPLYRLVFGAASSSAEAF